MEIVEQLFIYGKGLLLSKEEELTSEFQNTLKEFIFPPQIEKYHPLRRNEYQRSRLLAALLYKEIKGQILTELNSDENRAPHWPEGVCGSISHSADYVFVAMSDKSKLRSIGVDIEARGRVKKILSSHIQNERDIQTHPDLNESDLLTLIFSAKEALYKALYPLVNQFFGFDAASLIDVNLQTGEFVLALNKDLSIEFMPLRNDQIKGKFHFNSMNCLTVIEII